MVNIPSIYRVLYMPSGCLGFLPSTGFPIVHPDLMDVFFRTSCKDTGLTSRKTPVCPHSRWIALPWQPDIYTRGSFKVGWLTVTPNSWIITVRLAEHTNNSWHMRVPVEKFWQPRNFSESLRDADHVFIFYCTFLPLTPQLQGIGQTFFAGWVFIFYQLSIDVFYFFQEISWCFLDLFHVIVY